VNLTVTSKLWSEINEPHVKVIQFLQVKMKYRLQVKFKKLAEPIETEPVLKPQV
jgi:hypothetical protein